MNANSLPATDPKLLEALRIASQHVMTPAERRAQRRSFVIGQIGCSHPEWSRAEVEALVDSVLATENADVPTAGTAPAYVDGQPAKVFNYDTELGCIIDQPNHVASLMKAYKRLGKLLAEAETALATAEAKLAQALTDDEVEAACEAGWEELRSLILSDPAQAFEIGPWSAVPTAHADKGRAETRAALAAFLARRRR